MDRKELIINYIKDELLDEDIVLTEETSMFQTRILDSLNLLALISFVEKEFSIKVNSSEINLENLDTVSNILNFLDRKVSE